MLAETDGYQMAPKMVAHGMYIMSYIKYSNFLTFSYKCLIYPPIAIEVTLSIGVGMKTVILNEYNSLLAHSNRLFQEINSTPQTESYKLARLKSERLDVEKRLAECTHAVVHKEFMDIKNPALGGS